MLMRKDGSLSQQGRLLRTFIGVALVAAALVIAPQAAASGEDGSGEPQQARAAVFDTYTVADGETLWSIASAASPAGTDPQLAVRAIMEANGLTSSSLMTGQQILLPPLG